MTNLHLSYVIDLLHEVGPLDSDRRGQFVRCCGTLRDWLPDEVLRLLDAVRQHLILHAPAQEALLDPLWSQLVVRQRARPSPLSDEERGRIVALHEAAGAACRCRWRLLQWLAVSASGADLRALAECLVAGPPANPQSAALTLTPLFQRRDYDPAALFPRLFAALEHLSMAAPILDLANYMTRSGMVACHPGSHRGAELVALLGSLVQQLERVEENPPGAGETPEQLAQKVDQCVALVVSLSDAMALIGDTHAVGKLYQALRLRHRRIRTEAAAALARLGETAGVDALVALAAEPIARLRVVAHAQELGVADRIDPQHLTEAARAESQVALELAQPSFFGMPPSALQLIDSRTQFWPGYDQPVACYLFRYEYRLPDTFRSNIAIAGPLVHTFSADLHDLPPDDIYAAFAGWHVEDESIYEVPLDARAVRHSAEVERFERRLRDDRYGKIQSLLWGHFFGDRVLIARASRHDVPGIAVVDRNGVEWYPIRTQRHCLGAQEAFCIYKGRRLLRSFNR